MSILSDFKILIPEFAHLGDDTIQAWLDMGSNEVSKTGFRPEIRERLIIYLTADRMATSYRPKGVSGEIVSMSEGSLQVTYAKGKYGVYREMYKRLVRAHTITPITRACLW